MRWFLLVLTLSLVATCGQKGPLHLPGDEARTVFAQHQLSDG